MGLIRAQPTRSVQRSRPSRRAARSGKSHLRTCTLRREDHDQARSITLHVSPLPGGQISRSPADPSPDHVSAQQVDDTASEPPLPDSVLFRILAIYAAVRVATFVADVLAAHVGFGGNLNGPLTSWDSQYYIQIAAHGYPAISPRAHGHLTYSVAGFEPMFPAFIKLLSFATTSFVSAAILVSVFAGAIATLIVWRLASALTGATVGFNAAVLFMVFPGMAIPWGMFYCESLGLAFVAGSLLLIYHKRWFWAGLVGAFATATSPLALALAPAALVPALISMRRRQRPTALVTVVMVPMGFFAFALWLGVRYHDALYWWHLQNQAWAATVDWGKGLILLLPHLWAGGYVGKSWLEWIGIVAVAGAVFALWRARLPGYINAYCASIFVLLFISNQLGFKPRLLTWAFPALIAVAFTLRARAWQALAIGFAVLLPIVLIAYATLGDAMIQP